MIRIGRLSKELNVSPKRIASYLNLDIAHKSELLNYKLSDLMELCLRNLYIEDSKTKKSSTELVILKNNQFEKEINNPSILKEKLAGFADYNKRKKEKTTKKVFPKKFKSTPDKYFTKKGFKSQAINSGLMNGK